MTTTYLTTAIPYVNGAPHLGHALEAVETDVLARHRRLRGEHVRALTGTDDNALKNVTAARIAGQDVSRFVRENSARFAALRGPLELSFDDFISTGVDERHRRGVERLWRACAARGDFYQRSYSGSYCVGCEQFYESSDLVDGLCREHGLSPTPVTERNWFFRLSRYATGIEHAIESGRVRIEPTERRNEVLGFVRTGLRDFSVSRPASRSDGWGIPVPGDPEQVVYVWWDALTNYVTALGDEALLRTWWLESDERIHVIGKGIVRFHTVYWLGLLLSAGLPLPTAIFVHDYVSVSGAKLAKSAGNAVAPTELVDRFGTDALRWWLCRDVARVGETDFSVQRLVDTANRDLANGIGNLVSRTLTLARRGEIVPARPLDPALPVRIDAALHSFDIRGAAVTLCDAITEANRHIETHRPWTLSVDDPARVSVLSTLVATCELLVHELSPFVPGGAARLREQLASGQRPVPVFVRLS